MQKIIKIKEKELKNIIKESIKNILKESTIIQQYEHDNHVLSIVEYDMTNEEDKNYILSNKDIIWNILQKGYENKGGFKGFQTIKDMIKKCPFYKLGYYDDEIVTVTVYNGYLGGSKCVGVACTKDNKHQDAVKLLELIIEHNIVDWDKWIWIEASGKIEEKCKELGAFNVPVKYADIYLDIIPFTPIDEFHYERKITGNVETKTIFGFKDKDSFEIIKNELNNEVSNFLKKFNITIEENNNPNSLYNLYLSKKHPVYKCKSIIDYFVYLKDDELYNEFTEESIEILKQAIYGVQKYIDDDSLSEKEKYYLKIAIEEANRVINTSSIIKPLQMPFKFKSM